MCEVCVDSPQPVSLLVSASLDIFPTLLLPVSLLPWLFVKPLLAALPEPPLLFVSCFASPPELLGDERKDPNNFGKSRVIHDRSVGRQEHNIPVLISTLLHIAASGFCHVTSVVREMTYNDSRRRILTTQVLTDMSVKRATVLGGDQSVHTIHQVRTQSSKQFSGVAAFPVPSAPLMARSQFQYRLQY